MRGGEVQDQHWQRRLHLVPAARVLIQRQLSVHQLLVQRRLGVDAAERLCCMRACALQDLFRHALVRAVPRWQLPQRDCGLRLRALPTQFRLRGGAGRVHVQCRVLGPTFSLIHRRHAGRGVSVLSGGLIQGDDRVARLLGLPQWVF